MSHSFPKELYIAYATCNNCYHKEFIVSGQTQFCNDCGELLYRESERLYTLDNTVNNKEQKVFEKDKVSFPQEIVIGYATCSNALHGEEVVIKDRVICQECKEIMKIEDMTKYFLVD